MEDLKKTDELKVGKPYQYLWIVICGALFGLIPMGIQGSCLGVYYTALSETFSVPVSSISLVHHDRRHWLNCCLSFGWQAICKVRLKTLPCGFHSTLWRCSIRGITST